MLSQASGSLNNSSLNLNMEGRGFGRELLFVVISGLGGESGTCVPILLWGTSDSAICGGRQLTPGVQSNDTEPGEEVVTSEDWASIINAQLSTTPEMLQVSRDSPQQMVCHRLIPPTS